MSEDAAASQHPVGRSSAPQQETPSTERARAQGATGPGDDFPVVGIGASAGGFEALTELLDELPDDTGMAFVIVQHLSPEHKSQLADLLSGRNLMPVLEIEDGDEVQPDHVYTIPADASLAIENGRLTLSEREGGDAPQHTIDRFLTSLAEDRGAGAIGVVLSGTLNDGVVGLKEIQQAGGSTLAQEPESAAFPEMPRSAIEADAVDLVDDPAGLARELDRLSRHPYLRTDTPPAKDLPAWDTELLQEIHGRLKRSTSIEFDHYKETTVQRRILRRMMTTGCTELSEYVQLLRDDPEEVDKLREELLILVTRFFRNEAFYDALEETILPGIVEDRSPDEPIRIWVPGCSTGQEVYSIAITVHEFLNREGLDLPYQVFGSDVSPEAIDTAREGIYPGSIESEVPAQLLQSHFDRVDAGYRINKSIRGNCIFSRHDLTRDPPFANIDIVSCQNVIIYLDNVLQERALTMFHYALADGGWLALGTSEGVSQAPDLFKTTDLDAHVFRPRAVSGRVLHRFAAGMTAGRQGQRTRPDPHEQPATPDLADPAERILLERFAPPAVVVNQDLEIVAFRGDTDPYFQNPSGRATFNLLKLSRDNLGPTIGEAIEAARDEGRPVRREGVHYVADGHRRTVDLQVVPLAGPSGPGAGTLVVFDERDPEDGSTGFGQEVGSAVADRVASWLAPDTSDKDERIENLEQELASTREYLDSLTERYEATTEELRSANEEAVSTNEELQSTNEELETAKEELQATNEELVTLNEELQERSEKIQEINDDLVNLLDSVQLPIIMLGSDLRIRRFTPAAADLFNLIDGDVGRPLSDLNLPLDVDRLQTLMLDVLDDLQVEERSIETTDGDTYQMRIHPYRTSDDRIDGVVLVLLDAELRSEDPREEL